MAKSLLEVSPTSMLMLVAEKDTVTPTDLALEAYGRAREPKRLSMLPDAHFDPYVRHAGLAKREALAWFVRFLKDKGQPWPAR